MFFLPGSPWRRSYIKNRDLSDVKKALSDVFLEGLDGKESIFKGILELTEREQQLLLEEAYARHLNSLCQDIGGRRVVDMLDQLSINPDLSDEIINFMQAEHFSPILQKMYEDAAYKNAFICAYTSYAKETDDILAMYTRENARKMKIFPEYYLDTDKKIGVLPSFSDFIQDPDIINVLSERRGYSGSFYSAYFDKQKDTDFFETVREGRKNGDSIEKMTQDLYEKWRPVADDEKEVSFGAINNVVRTEIDRARAQGSVLADQKSGYIVAYKFFNAVDGRTTEVCRLRDGLLLDANNDEIMRKNTPPLHYQCRSELIPLSEIALEDEGGYEQLARDSDYILSLPEFDW